MLLYVATVAALAGAGQTVLAASMSYSSPLSDFALQYVLQRASPILGNYVNVQSNTSLWMKAYQDSTQIVHMNLPGTHDSDTWNYSQTTQNSLNHVTDLDGLPEIPPEYFRCQDSSIINMLDAGIRVFDLRYAADATNTSLVFWHGQALQSETATLDDVLFGFYQWVEDHPSEAIFLSFQYEGSTKLYASEDVIVQTLLYNALTSPAARHYFVQTKDQLGTLGEARGKLTLLRRFDLDLLPASYMAALPGLYFSPNDWTDNSPNITLVYSTAQDLTAYIEDYYAILTPLGSPATENIQWKLNATEAHLTMAANMHPGSLFWTFASSENDVNVPPETPSIMALGNGTQYTPLGGVNQQLVPFLKTMTGKRVGIVMFDFYETPSELVPLLLSLQPPV